MEFGVQFFPQVGPADKSAEDYFAQSLSIAEEAEQLGYTHARIVEHYFHPYGGYSPNPLLFLAALSQRTRHMRLVTGAVLPVFNHPLKLAGELAMLDAISHGRLDIGFARAFLKHEFRRFGISPDESNARFREGLEQIDLLLTQENVTHRGQFHRFEHTTSLPRPTQRPRPKFYIAATQTPESFEFAGHMGYSLMAIPMGGSKMKELFEIYRDAWRNAGHSGNGEIMVAFHMFCHADREKAHEIARGPLDAYFRAFAEVTNDWVEGTASKDYRGYGESMAKLKTATLDSQIANGGGWIGTPADIRDIIASVVERIGAFEHASIQVNFGTLPFAEAQTSLRLFAAEVMPHFRSPAERRLATR